jgi:hypothetical protein
VDGFEEVIIDHMKLGANVVCLEIANEADRTGMQRRGAHVLTLLRPRFPLWHLSSILEPRLKNIDWTAPRMGIDNGREGRFGSTPNFMRSES